MDIENIIPIREDKQPIVDFNLKEIWVYQLHSLCFNRKKIL